VSVNVPYMENPIQLVRNPYKMIMVTCPISNKPIATGVNSLYFDEWEQSGTDPPPTSFQCPDCHQTHRFDKSNRWLQEI